MTPALASLLLAEYRQPAIDEAVLEEINAFVERRVGEGGVATDF